MSRKRTDTDIGGCDGKSFGRIVRKLRVEKKLKISAFAEQVGICRNYVSQIESGDKLPSFETLLLIAKVLGVTPNDLLVDYIDSSKQLEVRSKQIEEQLKDLNEEQRWHVQDMIAAEVAFLKRQ